MILNIVSFSDFIGIVTALLFYQIFDLMIYFLTLGVTSFVDSFLK